MPGLIQRDRLAGMIPEPVSREIFQGVVEQSAVLKAGRRLPNMTSKTQSINVLDMLPMAYWVDGDTGYKETAGMAWEKKKLYAEELAVIIPIPEAVLDDANYDIWGEVKPRLVEAMGRRIDEAVLFGTGKPSTWRKAIVKTAKDAGNYVRAHAGTAQDHEDVFGDIMGVGGAKSDSAKKDSGRKVVVDLVNVDGGKVNLAASVAGKGAAAGIPLPSIKITDIGRDKGKTGTSLAETVSIIIQKILTASYQAVVDKGLANVKDAAVDGVKAVGDAAEGAVEGTKGFFKNLF